MVKLLSAIALLFVSFQIQAAPQIDGNTLIFPEGDMYYVTDINAGQHVCRKRDNGPICGPLPAGTYRWNHLGQSRKIILDNDNPNPPPSTPGISINHHTNNCVLGHADDGIIDDEFANWAFYCESMCPAGSILTGGSCGAWAVFNGDDFSDIEEVFEARGTEFDAETMPVQTWLDNNQTTCYVDFGEHFDIYDFVRYNGETYSINAYVDMRADAICMVIN